MTALEFVAKWQRAALTERSASQQHFLDLCALLDHPTPADADPTGDWFTFERGAAKHGGGDGFADVWKQGFFGWEYKGKHKDLDAAYDQLLRYRDALQNPPLLVTCDMDRIEIHTNFTGTTSQLHRIPLAELDRPRNLQVLRDVFRNPEKLKPGATSEAITTQAARRLADIAQSLRSRGLAPRDVAHFLDRIVFCLFADDIGLLPDALFTRLVEKTRRRPADFSKLAGDLFRAMAVGGYFGLETIRYFNGNLFTEETILELDTTELESIHLASRLDWSDVDPSILGTLFERGLDPAKRSQLGAHYTSRQDIETLVDPVVMAPLRKEWSEAKTIAQSLLTTGRRPGASGSAALSARPVSSAAMAKAREEAYQIIFRFHERLGRVTVLDPACGSGNFLYVTLQKLKDLEKEVVGYALAHDFSAFLPLVGPWQLYGIEVNPYAYDLAQMTVWIGYLQWMRANGYMVTDNPILRSMTNFECKDAVLDLSDPEHPREPEWPAAEFIVGNPPFLGDKKMRDELGDDYVEALRRHYAARVPGGADLCCYWFERTRAEIESRRCSRAGLLATQGIRGGANRRVLKRIKETGDIFFAVSDRRWILDGASVHVSLVGMDDGTQLHRVLNDAAVPEIHSNLTAAADVTSAQILAEDQYLSFLGSCKGGPFDIDEDQAILLLHTTGNPHGRPNSDVIRPVVNSRDLLTRSSRRWIIDNADLPLERAANYEAPHAHVVAQVKPSREVSRDRWLRENWWRPQRMRPLMRQSTEPLPRFLVTTTTSKHRIFVWLNLPLLPDHQLIVFARCDDTFFGILHSRIHELWARAQGTQLREVESGFRYTPTTCFETFPLPKATGEQTEEIAAAASELDRRRNAWLNPPDWTREYVLEFPGSVDGVWSRYVHGPDHRGIGTVRFPRVTSLDSIFEAKLADRTLTELYNRRPDWLSLAHRKLDLAVFAAYGWDPALSDDQVLERLLRLNLERAPGTRQTLEDTPALSA